MLPFVHQIFDSLFSYGDSRVENGQALNPRARFRGGRLYGQSALDHLLSIRS